MCLYVSFDPGVEPARGILETVGISDILWIC